jgi:predicted metalloprotease with PDZ domain
MVRDFARHLYDLDITDDEGRPLASQRVDKQRWRVSHDGRAVRATYRIFAFEVSVRTSFLDAERGFISGTSVFFFVEGQLERPCELQVEPPPDWQVHTALPALRGRRSSFAARDYDELVDAPLELGQPRVHEFRVDDTRFQVTLSGRTNADVRRLLSDLRKIVRAAGAMFDGFPFQRYLFIVHFLPNRGGGLEHASSTALDVAGLAFEDEKAYQNFNELAAHEFFHAWNVKRIRDRVLGPFDYTAENYTRLLWFHEGFTEYMESHVLLRAGLLSEERYLADLAESWGRFACRPGRTAPLSELSFEAWIKQYKPAENHVNRAVSYYEKGKWAALILDLMLRQWTQGRRGLPDLFRRLWRDHARHGEPIDVDVVRTAGEAVGGHSLADYFARFIDGRAELPVAALLRRSGVVVTARAPGEPGPSGDDDQTKVRRRRGWTGLQFANNGAGAAAIVKNVIPGSPAWRAGLTFNDEILAVDGCRVNAATVTKRLADHGPGAHLPIAFFRGDTLRTTALQVLRNPERRWTFALDERASSLARRARKAWLQG